jgi:hypothetical protein
VTGAVEASRLRAAAPNDRLGVFMGADFQAVWESAPILARREVIETLFVVTIEPQGMGKRFDSETIRIDWQVA